MSTQLKPSVGSNDHLQGNRNAPLELVEFGDYQCPHCGRAYPIIKAVQQSMGDQLKFVFRNFPLSEIHPEAFESAIATEAAALQDKFWEMHDIIFEHQLHLDPEYLFLYAQKIGLDLNQFKDDIQRKALADKVEADFESGVRSGVNGTPSFFINGKKYQGSWEQSELLKHFHTELNINKLNK
jgi:protein-disulfide isomerase